MYGFGICLGVGLLFGFLVWKQRLTKSDSYSLHSALPASGQRVTCSKLTNSNFFSWHVVKCFLPDARKVCNTVYTCKSAIHCQVRLIKKAPLLCGKCRRADWILVPCSTMFLMGPLSQFKKMFEKGRIIATCLYFGAMFLTLWMAIKVRTILKQQMSWQWNVLLTFVVVPAATQLSRHNTGSPCPDGRTNMVKIRLCCWRGLSNAGKRWWWCFCALCRYCMSYIPFARAMATKMFSSFMSGWFILCILGAIGCKHDQSHAAYVPLWLMLICNGSIITDSVLLSTNTEGSSLWQRFFPLIIVWFCHVWCTTTGIANMAKWNEYEQRGMSHQIWFSKTDVGH